MTVNFENIQRVTVSVLGALVLATVFIGTAIAPAEAAVLTLPIF
ncbi:MAG: hypothetical protein ACREXT_18015 [Gammaproteobacteria bacterium]